MPTRRPFSRSPFPASPTQQANRFPILMLLAGAVVALASIVGVLRSTMDMPSRVVPRPDVAGPENVPHPAMDPEAARRVLERFLSAGTIEEVARTILDKPDTLAAMRAYYRDRPQALPPGGAIVSNAPGSRMSLSRDVLWWKVKMPDGVVRPAATVAGADGPRLLWEAFVAYGEMPWDDFLEKGSPEPVALRVLLRPAPGLASETSGQEFLHVEVAHPDSFGTLIARVERDVDRANLMGVFDRGSNGQRVTARFTFPGGNSGTDSPVLREILADDWGESHPISGL